MRGSRRTIAGVYPAPREDRSHARSEAPRGVLVVDDHPAVRRALERLLGADVARGPITSAATATGAVAAAWRARPAVAVVDYRLPDRDGIALTFELKRLPEPPGVLIYTAFAGSRLTLAALVAGADGVVNKGAGGEELCSAVAAVAEHSRAMPPLSAAALEPLTGRLDVEDLPVVEMLIEGASADEVARRIEIRTEWLELRRWAIARRLVGPERQSPR